MVKDCEIGERVNQDRKKLQQRMKGGESGVITRKRLSIKRKRAERL